MSIKMNKSVWIQSLLRLSVAIWIATAIAMAVSICIDAAQGAVLASSKDLIAPLVAATGVLIAVLAYSRDRGKIERDRDEARSRIFLDQAKQSFEQAHELLKGLTQERVKWVRAARLLSEGQKLGQAIPSPDYQRVYALAVEHYRHLFQETLIVSNGADERSALPPAFFYGLADWETSTLKLDQVAGITAPRIRLRVGDGMSPLPKAKGHGIDEQSVIVVYEFLRFPDSYKDPLDEVDSGVWKHWSKKSGLAQGAYRYLEHRKRYIQIGGGLLDTTTLEPVKIDVDTQPVTVASSEQKPPSPEQL